MTIRFGLAGTGHWARIVHVPGLLAVKGVELAGIWGRSSEATRSLASEHGIAAFDRFDDMLSAVDAVSFAVPPDVQAALAPRAASAGRHLLLEKPIARSSAAAERIAEAAAAADVCTLVFFLRRFVEGIETAVQEAAAHPWRHASARAHHAALSTDTPYARSPWRQEQGAALWDIGPHVLSVLIPVLGTVREVIAHPADAARIARATAPNRLTRFTTVHAGGASAEVSVTLHAQPAEEATEYRFESTTESRTLPSPVLDRIGAFTIAAGELVQNIGAHRRAHRCDVDFGAEVVRVLAAVERSAAARRPIALAAA